MEHGTGPEAGKGTFGRAAVLGLAVAGTCLVGTLAAPDAAAQQTEERRYEVEEGDTLWEIAERMLDDPFLWQRIWEANRGRLSSPDLLLPGQRLQIPTPSAEEAGRDAPAGRDEAAARRGRDTVPPPRASIFDAGRPAEPLRSGGGITAEERPPLRPVSWGDAHGAPFLAHSERVAPRGRVLGPVAAGGRASRAWQGRSGDAVRLRLRGLEAAAGDTLVVLRTGRTVGDRGRVFRPVGLLRVDSARGGTAVARVAAVFGLVRGGDEVVSVPLPEAPAGTEFRPPERELGATVLATANGEGLLREGGYVFLDHGSSAGVRPGDVFRIAAPGASGTGAGNEGGMRVIVVRVRPASSTARVVDVGDGTAAAGESVRLVQRLAGPGR